ncbi:MAG: HAAS signaling domain-containing protein [Dermatophilaceae bacterium]
MTGLDHPLVRAYLARVDALAGALPAGRRAELRADLEEHLAEALPEDVDDEVVTRTLGRLGSPEGVVAEAAGTPAPTHTETGATTGPPRVEQAAVLASGLSLATALSVVLVVLALFLWLAGVVLTLFSRRWSVGDKALSVVAYGVLGFPLVAASTTSASGGSACPGGDDAGGISFEVCASGVGLQAHAAVLVVGGLALLTLWVGAGIHLWRRARRATPAEQAHVIRMR